MFQGEFGPPGPMGQKGEMGNPGIPGLPVCSWLSMRVDLSCTSYFLSLLFFHSFNIRYIRVAIIPELLR